MAMETKVPMKTFEHLGALKAILTVKGRTPSQKVADAKSELAEIYKLLGHKFEDTK